MVDPCQSNRAPPQVGSNDASREAAAVGETFTGYLSGATAEQTHLRSTQPSILLQPPTLHRSMTTAKLAAAVVVVSGNMQK